MYLLGIDCGNTVTKVTLVTARGDEVATASRRADTLRAAPGHAERDMAALWRSVAGAIQDVLAAARVRGADVAAVGCTGHGNGLYALDRAGAPLGHAIQSLDGRAAALLAEWQRGGVTGAAYALSRQSNYAAQTAVLLAWLKRHQPADYARIGTVLLAKDYLNFCLTGVRGSDYTDLSTTGLLNLTRRDYDADLLGLYGLEDIRPALPGLHASTDVIGQVHAEAARQTGLSAGTPVIAGMIDIDASAIGAGVVQPGLVSVVVGSWSINQAVAAVLPEDADLFLQSVFADPRYWLLCEASATSASNLEWFIQQFCGEEQRTAAAEGTSVYEVCGRAVASVPAVECDVIYHPFLYGANLHPHARAGFFNLSGWHTRAHLLRALYEGIVYGHRFHIDRLKAAGVRVEVVRLAGGAARSSLWTQMFADVLDVPVEVTASQEPGTLGAALAAGVGVGMFADLASAVAGAVRVERTASPNPENHALYQARYARFTRLIGAMRPEWDAVERPEYDELETRQ